MKSTSLGVLIAVTTAAAVAPGCGGSGSGNRESEPANGATAAQAPARDIRQVAAVSAAGAEPLEAPAAGKPGDGSDRPHVQVLGIAGTPAGRLAMVAVGTAAPALRRVGDSIAGEPLLRIGVDYIVLGAPGSSRTIRVGGETDLSHSAGAAAHAPAPDTAPEALGAGTPFASNRAFEQMLSLRQGRTSP